LQDEIAGRPAAARAVALRDAYPFKTEWDDAARAVMFPHIARPAA
jgi:GST-like protein